MNGATIRSSSRGKFNPRLLNSHRLDLSKGLQRSLNFDLNFFTRYASLYFAAGIEKEDNELIVLDVIHHFVEILDRYFGNVCELDLIFNFHQAYFILEELVIGGHIMESSKKQVLKMIQQNDALMDEAFFKDEGQNKSQAASGDKK